MNNEKSLVESLRQLGKYSEFEPNYFLLAADRIEELSGRVEVCRCKDCKHCEIFYPKKAIGEESEIVYYCTALEYPTKPTDFCSYGERKESEVDTE